MKYSSSTSLSPVQAQVVLSLASGESISAAAKSAGCSRTSVYKWLHDSDSPFAKEIEIAKAHFTLALRDELRDASLKAIRTLSSLMDSETARDSVRLKAALAMLNRPDSWILPELVSHVQVRRAEETLAECTPDEEPSNPQPQPEACTKVNTSEQVSQSSVPVQPDPATSPVSRLHPTGDFVDGIGKLWEKPRQEAERPHFHNLDRQ